MRSIVIYATHEGQTDSIGQEIARVMRGAGLPTDTYNVARSPAMQIAVDSYDAVVMGSPLHWGGFDSRIGWCMKEHRHFLETVPTAFFSVSLGAASDNNEEREAAAELAKSFVARHHFDPKHLVCFAGALKYSQYGLIKKYMMHMIAQRHHADADTRQDYEFTSWDRVDGFAEAFAQEVIEEFHRVQLTRKRRARVAAFSSTY